MLAIDVCISFSASEASAGHSVSAVAFMDAAAALMALNVCASSSWSSRAKMAPFLLLTVDQPRGELRPLVRSSIKVCGERVEDFADSLKLNQPEARQAVGEVAARQPVEAHQDILCGPQRPADRNILQKTDRDDNESAETEQPRNRLPDRGQR